MKALVVEKIAQRLVPRIKEVEIPKCKDNDVLIKVKKVGICGSDFHLFSKNSFSGPKLFPRILGHEFSGIIVKVGKKVSSFKIGDIVACESVVSCEKCNNCVLIKNFNCKNADLIGFTKDGAFADFISINYNHVFKINDLISKFGRKKGMVLGAILEPLGCAYKAIFIVNKNYNFDYKNFLIFGAGSIGLCATWLISTKTKAKLFLIDDDKNKLNIAKNMNCERINAHISDDLFLSNDLPKIDFVFESSGAKLDFDKIIPHSFNSNATFIYIARNAVKINMVMDTFVTNDFTLIGSRGHRGSYSHLIEIIKNCNISSLMDIIDQKEINFFDLPKILTNQKNSRKRKLIVNIDTEE